MNYIIGIQFVVKIQKATMNSIVLLNEHMYVCIYVCMFMDFKPTLDGSKKSRRPRSNPVLTIISFVTAGPPLLSSMYSRKLSRTFWKS